MGIYNRYITGSAVTEGAGMLVLQEAGIRTAKGTEISVILALTFLERGDRQRELSVDIGEWFQNALVPMIKRDGVESLIKVCIDGLGRDDFYEQINEHEYACAIVAGNSCALFMNGDVAGMYTVEELLGRPMMIPMKANRDGIMVELGEGGAIIIADNEIKADGFYAGEIARSISEAGDERTLGRLLNEVVNIEEAGCKAIIGIKVAD